MVDATGAALKIDLAVIVQKLELGRHRYQCVGNLVRVLIVARLVVELAEVDCVAVVDFVGDDDPAHFAIPSIGWRGHPANSFIVESNGERGAARI